MKRKVEAVESVPVDSKRVKTEELTKDEPVATTWVFDTKLAHKRLNLSEDMRIVSGPEFDKSGKKGDCETMAVMGTEELEAGKIHKWSISVENDVPKHHSKNWIRIGVGCKDEYLLSSNDYNPVKGKPRHKCIYECRTCNVKPNMKGDKFKWEKGDVAECTLDLLNKPYSFVVHVKRGDETMGTIQNRDELNMPKGGFYPFVRIFPKDSVRLL
jgi:hypothetical protein